MFGFRKVKYLNKLLAAANQAVYWNYSSALMHGICLLIIDYKDTPENHENANYLAMRGKNS